MENSQNPVQEQIAKPVSQIVKKFPTFDFKALAPYIAGIVLVVLAGVGTGWLISGGPKTLVSGSKSVPGAKTGPSEAGLADEKTFKDTAQGTLEEGGISGEGTHHLVRTGGTSQTVYLTSTVIDLQSFVGKKVQVWGETISAKKAGWLMDVGKIKVTE
jgi:hypothetical protein